MTKTPATEEMTTQGPKKEVTALSVATALALYKEDLHNPNIWKGDSGLCANIDKAIDMLLAPAKALDASETVDLEALKREAAEFALNYWQAKPDIFGAGFKNIQDLCQKWTDHLHATGRLKGAGE